MIQKHAARRLHYDFRLELDGVLLELGGAEGAQSGSERETARGTDRGSSGRYGSFEGTIPRRRVRRRHGHGVGPRDLESRRAIRGAPTVQGG